MELNSVICNRRSIRKYKKDQIDKNIIINILKKCAGSEQIMFVPGIYSVIVLWIYLMQPPRIL